MKKPGGKKPQLRWRSSTSPAKSQTPINTGAKPAPSGAISHLCSPHLPTHIPLHLMSKVALGAQCPPQSPNPGLPHFQHPTPPSPIASSQPSIPRDPLPDSPSAAPTSPGPPLHPNPPGHAPPAPEPPPQAPPRLTGAGGRAAGCTCSRPHRPGPARPWPQTAPALVTLTTTTTSVSVASRRTAFTSRRSALRHGAQPRWQ